MKNRPNRTSAKAHIIRKNANKRQKWSKDRSECVLDALNRDADLLYNVLKTPSTKLPPSMSQTDTVGSLVECMEGLDAK